MTDRIKTHVKSPYIGLFQYKSSGPPSIHANPNNTLLPTTMPYVGTFKHNFPWFLPNYIKVNRNTQDVATQTEPEKTTKTREINTQTNTDLNTYVIVKYMDD
jgi:hypothetical protein